MKSSIAIAIACLMLLQQARAQDSSIPRDNIFDIQKRAGALLEKARQLSDMHAPTTPAFRLKATFSFNDKSLETVQGTYLEVWVSKSRWRREITTKDSRRTEVGGPTRFWRLDNAKEVPTEAARLPAVMEIFPRGSDDLEFLSLTEARDSARPTQCAITEPDSANHKSAFCFDKQTGLLVERIFPGVRPRNVVADTCDYNSFHDALDRWFPFQIHCYEDRHLTLSVQITELIPEPAPDSALFTPPPGALELGNCAVKPDPPRPVSTPEPGAPSGSKGQGSVVMISVLVNIKGDVQSAEVASSGGAAFDEKSLKAARRWRFKPATCNGEAMPALMNLEFDFPAYHF